jgi:hypothetical protein
MKKIILFLFSINCFSQVPVMEWQKSYGGSHQDLPFCIQQTNDGGYITAGYTLSTDGNITINHGDADFWIVKTNSNGVIEWQKTFGGTDYEYAFDIVQTSDNGYIVAGYTASNNGDITLNRGITDYWIVKLNATGTLQWQKTYGGSSIDYAYSIKQASDGGYILLGETLSNNGNVSLNHGSFDIWILKLNSSGTIQWSKTYGGSGSDYASMISLTTDGGYIIAGNTYSNDGDVSGYHNDKDFWFVKINSTGIIQWQKVIGGSQWDFLKAVEQTSDGGYIGVGQSLSNDGDHISPANSQGWVVKLSSLGLIQWEKAIGNFYVLDLVSVKEKLPGEYVVAGCINYDIYGYPLSQNYWITKINNSGNVIWEKMFGGSDIDIATSVIETSDNGYAVVGYSNSTNGDITNGHNIYDFWIVKLSSEQLSTPEPQNNILNIYPNPTSKNLNILTIDKIIITNLNGKTIFEQTTNNNLINVEDFANGIYFIQAISGTKHYTSKFIKQ